MNKTPYDDIFIKVLDLINNVAQWILKFKKHKKRFGNDFNNIVEKNVDRLKVFETTPRGHGYKNNYSPVKFKFKDELEQDFFTNIKNLPVYLQDYTDVDFSQGYFIIKKKSQAARLLDGIDKGYRDTSTINKYIKSGDLYDDLFYVENITKEVFKLEKEQHPERILTPLCDK